jgi:LPXTG-motif cell wall-anchored protein
MARLDLGGAVSNAAAGVATGAASGNPLIAAGTGLLGFAGGLFGGKKKKKKRSTLDKRQQMINEQQAQALNGQGPLSDLYNYDPEAANATFDKNIGRPAYRNFQENVIPGITGSFRSEGLQNSSYAGDALSKAGRDVQESLDAKRSQYLYDEQKDARGAKRNAVENYQNRTNFDYDTGDQGGFDIDKIVKSIGPGGLEKLSKWLDQQKGI